MHPILVSIPHCSQHIPSQLADYILITDYDIKNHSDLYTDEIFDVENAHVIKATSQRILCDPNRFLLEDTMKNINEDGVISSLTPCGEFVYKNLPAEKYIEEIIENHYLSYHAKIEQMIGKHDIKFIIDGHSMWSHGPSHLQDAGVPRPEISLGNRMYTTCTNEQTEFIANYFIKLGYNVGINSPYPGRSIIKMHCSTKRTPGLHIEINRSLYMDEKSLKKDKKAINKFKREITKLIDEIDKEKDIFYLN